MTLSPRAKRVITHHLSSLSLRLLDRFDIELDLDILADQEAAGLERCIPGQVEVLAVDLGPGGPGSDLGAEWGLATALIFGFQRDRASDAADRQIAVNSVCVTAFEVQKYTCQHKA
jgi:hypothetical protein